MSCEHEWVVEDMTSWSDEGYPLFLGGTGTGV